MANAETELVFYARVGNPAGLEQASEIIYQEQAQIKAPNGRIRVRMEKPKDAAEWSYNLLTKTGFSTASGVQSSIEAKPVAISAETYERFKQVSDRYMRKIRYVFKVERASIEAPGFEGQLDVADLCYEVDRFINSDGALSEWVKIDLEIDSLLKALEKAGLSLDVQKHIVAKLSALPWKPVSAFFDDGSKGNSMRALVDEIYERQFIRKQAPVQTQ